MNSKIVVHCYGCISIRCHCTEHWSIYFTDQKSRNIQTPCSPDGGWCWCWCWFIV